MPMKRLSIIDRLVEDSNLKSFGSNKKKRKKKKKSNNNE
jgi:hypothetical protein